MPNYNLISYHTIFNWRKICSNFICKNDEIFKWIKSYGTHQAFHIILNKIKLVIAKALIP
jgi:hypothetical protein